MRAPSRVCHDRASARTELTKATAGPRQGGDAYSWFGVALACLSARPAAGGATSIQLAVGDPFALATDGSGERVRAGGRGGNRALAPKTVVCDGSHVGNGLNPRSSPMALRVEPTDQAFRPGLRKGEGEGSPGSDLPRGVSAARLGGGGGAAM